MKHTSKTTILALAILTAFSGWSGLVFAHSGTVDQLSIDIENKEAEIESIRHKIDQYRDKIEAYENQQSTLTNEIAILENRMKKTQLDIEYAEAEIDKVELEIEHTDESIKLAEEDIEEAKEMIEVVLQELYTYDEAGPIELLFGNEVFSEFFDQVQYLETLQSDISSSLEQINALQAKLESDKERQLEQKDRLLTMREELQSTKTRLEHEQSAKDVLLASAEHSEAQFRVLVRELAEERQYIQTEIFRLQELINARIESGDEEAQEYFSGPTVLSWPVSEPIITATFHDPTYPFRHLFEHSGLDMAIPQGTQLRAAAPGYVAWARTGSRGYGNYVMIVHANGIATLYAHMSRIDVVADEFVQRGQQIGLTGGIPGTPGAGLSTGAHLHFEVREDGIPVDPYIYLMDL